MIEVDQIPDEVVEAAAKAIYEAWCAFHGVIKTSMPWEDIDDEERQACITEASASIAAALIAWPGSYSLAENDSAEIRGVAAIILPLPQDARDE